MGDVVDALSADFGYITDHAAQHFQAADRTSATADNVYKGKSLAANAGAPQSFVCAIQLRPGSCHAPPMLTCNWDANSCLSACAV